MKVHIFTWSTRYSRQIIKKLEYSGQIFEKYSNVSFHESTSSGTRVLWWQTDGRTNGRAEERADERTDEHDEVNSAFLQFCEQA